MGDMRAFEAAIQRAMRGSRRDLEAIRTLSNNAVARYGLADGIQIIGYWISELPISKNRSPRIWKKLCNRRRQNAVRIWESVDVERLVT